MDDTSPASPGRVRWRWVVTITLLVAGLAVWRWVSQEDDKNAVVEGQVRQVFAQTRRQELRAQPLLRWLELLDGLKSRLLKQRRSRPEPRERLEALGLKPRFLGLQRFLKHDVAARAVARNHSTPATAASNSSASKPPAQ